jgi:hypothetical protein
MERGLSLGDHLKKLTNKSLKSESTQDDYHKIRLTNLIYVKLTKEASKSRDNLTIIITKRTSMKDILLYGEGKNCKFDDGRINSAVIRDINTRYINYLNVSDSLIQQVISDLRKESLQIISDTITIKTPSDIVYGLNISWRN